MAKARKKKQPMTHAEKLQRAIRDTKDVLILLGLLLVVLVVWDVYFINKTAELRKLEERHAETRRKMMDEVDGVTPEFALDAAERRSKSRVSADLRDMVVDIVVKYNIPTEVGGKVHRGDPNSIDIAKAEEEVIDESTRVEYVELKKIREVEMWRIVEMLLKLEEHSDNTTWCTQIQGIEPIRNPDDNFVMETTKGDPVYNIKSLRISRFSENKDE